ncbi:hypothetical protein J4G37_42595, partial [Microvirga sp. 3-52]|nr:hypothetical protein [Microvirga sp. 3-52]
MKNVVCLIGRLNNGGGEKFMNAIVLALIGMIILGLGYRYYSKFVAEKIFRLDPNYITPAHRY